MLILPIGQEHGEVRRQPWVSYAIIGLNVVVFAFLWAASIRSDVPARFEEKAREWHTKEHEDPPAAGAQPAG